MYDPFGSVVARLAYGAASQPPVSVSAASSSKISSATTLPLPTPTESSYRPRNARDCQDGAIAGAWCLTFERRQLRLCALGPPPLGLQLRFERGDLRPPVSSNLHRVINQSVIFFKIHLCCTETLL